MGLANWPGSSDLLVTLITIIIMVHKSLAAPNFVTTHCSNDTSKYAANSSYASNLNTLLHSLSTNATTNPTGYFTTSVGSNADDTVYGLFLCRGDQNTSGCNECVATAAKEEPQRMNCPRTKEGILWYDECMIRYDNKAVAGTLGQSFSLKLSNTANISGDQQAFMNLLGTTMKELMVQAANSPQSTGKKYANMEVDFTSLQTVYAMVQCIPDLSSSECNQCLANGINQLSVNQGAQVLQPSCKLRYEIVPFLDTGYNSSSPAPPPQPSSNSTTGTTRPGTSTKDAGKKKASTGVIVAIVVPTAAIAVTLLALGSCLLKKNAKKYNAVVGETVQDMSEIQSLQYDLGTLAAATNNFAYENKLGEGGFGGVYKGTLENGKEIAVKKLSGSSSQGVQEFKNEVLLVAKLQHRNLVRILGFCVAGEEKLLVYEYLPNKSLDYFLFDPQKQGQLNWERRYKIIEGIARGMLYLHQDSQLRIIHRDLKPSNILLDENMNPKISDFGMARIFHVDQAQGNTSRVAGTYGYMAPEYAMHGQFSAKSDVYSFGVLVLEIISGKRSNNFYQKDDTGDLFSYGWKIWKEGTPLSFVDPIIRDSCSTNEVMRCLHLGLSCLQESVAARPTMATIVLALDSHSVTLPVPSQPTSFSSNAWTKSKVDNSDQSSTKSSKPWSVNDVSITDLDAR